MSYLPRFSFQAFLTNPEKIIYEIQCEVLSNFRELWNSVKALTYSLCQERKEKEALQYHFAIQHMIESDRCPGISYREQQLIMADSKAEAAD